jgi:pyrroline-5-carboxylate reductase
MTRLGVIGTGHLASYFIAALRRGGYERSILLSPRNGNTAARLARDYHCRVAASNDDVLAGADVILLSVRPQNAAQAFMGLRWENRHTALSAMAGIPVGDIRRLAPGAGAIHRIMPGSYIEAARGPVPLYPSAPDLMPLLACAGEIVILPDERAFEAAMIAICVSTWIYDLADAVSDELSRHGLEPGAARALTLGNIAGPASFALSRPQEPLAAISASVATERTFAKMGLDHLKERGFDAPWREAIAILSAKLRKAP